MNPSAAVHASSRRLGWSSRSRLDLAVTLACLGLALGVTWLHGADLNWDLLNYHLYLPFALVHGRLGSEFMAAGMVSYLNPLPMLPFYAMVAAGWHSLCIGLVLGAEHAINLVLLWKICQHLLGGESGAPSPRAWPLLALAIGSTSPLFLAELGTSYADIATSPLVLGGVLLLLDWRGAPQRALAAGLLLGAAVGLKLTNMPFALGSATLLLAPAPPGRRRWPALACLALGGLAGAALTEGYWAATMYAEFHNPVFPFANGLFKSPDFPALSHLHRRFLPQSLGEALALPFSMAIPKAWIYTEVFAPDPRFAFCVLAAAVAGVRALCGRRPPMLSPRWGGFLAYMLVSWCLWELQFANGRYFLPLALLVGPALLMLLALALPPRRVALAALLCLALQGGQLMVNRVMSFGGTGRWPAHWIALEVPAKLVQHPYLYLSLQQQSYSYVAPFVHPDSRFLNADGMMPLDLEGPGGERVRQELAHFAGATRILVNLVKQPAAALATPLYIAALDADLNRFGLRVDTRDCETIVNGDLASGIHVEDARVQEAAGAFHPATMLSCATLAAPVDPALQAQRARAAQAFDLVEQSCPRQFPSRWHGVVMRSISAFAWSRFYVDTDLTLLANNSHLYAEHPRFELQDLGTLNGLLAGSVRVPCERIRWHAPKTLALDQVAGG
jgi:hypothetical protein